MLINVSCSYRVFWYAPVAPQDTKLLNLVTWKVALLTCRMPLKMKKRSSSRTGQRMLSLRWTWRKQKKAGRAQMPLTCLLRPPRLLSQFRTRVPLRYAAVPASL